MPKRFRTLLAVLICVLGLIIHGSGAEISVANGKLRLRAGILERTLDLSQGQGVTGTISVDGKPAVSTPLPELLLTVSRAAPNRRPDSFKAGVGGELQSRDTFDKTATPGFLDDKRLGQTVGWVEPLALNSADLGAAFGPATYQATAESNGLKRLIIQIPAKADGPLPGLVVELHYALYDEHPVIRKWVSLRNGGSRWLKLDNFTIDPLDLASRLPVRTPLTPADYGAQSKFLSVTLPSHYSHTEMPNTRIEPLSGSAVRFVLDLIVGGALPLMAHPQRWAQWA